MGHTDPRVQTTDASPLVPARVQTGVLVALGALAAASLATVLIVYPAGAPTSSDPGAPAIPTWVVLLPALVGIALTLTVPPRSRVPALPARITDHRRWHLTTWPLLAIVVAFPLLVFTVDGIGYVLLKAVLFIAVPALLVAVVRGAVHVDRPRAAWRWWAPGIVVLAWFVLAQLAPWNPSHSLAGVDPVLLAVGATLTAITAGFGEEFIYRRLLQTRLEAALGPWTGIALTSLLFACMHLASHGTGSLWLDIARVIVAQGSFGLLMGVMWWRYRNFTAIVLVHLLVNGWAVVAHFALGG